MDWLSSFLAELLNPASGPDGNPGVLQFLAALALAYFGGVLSSLTPCVYPMIPITISAMRSRTSGTQNGRRCIVDPFTTPCS